MTTKHKNNKVLVFAFGVAFFSSGCSWSFQNWNYQQAIREQNKGQYSKALLLYTKVIRRKPEAKVALEASRQAARIAVFDLKDFQAAIEFYRNIILFSPDASERLDSQRRLAELYFSELLNFDQAIIEYSHLIKLLPVGERSPYRLLLAKAYFNLNNFTQAEVEVDDLLHKKIPENLRFEAMVFKGNLLQTAKRLDEAIEVFEQLVKKYPERTQEEKVIINLAVCYEEKSDFDKAIQVLEKAKIGYPSPEFLDIRIARLRERKANLPGAQGPKR